MNLLSLLAAFAVLTALALAMSEIADIAFNGDLRHVVAGHRRSARDNA